MAITIKRQVGGLGLGAATPAQPLTPQIKKPDPYVPSVSRPRVGGVPQADQATPTVPRRRYIPPKPPAAAHIPEGGAASVRTVDRARNVATVSSSGISGIWDATGGRAIDAINAPGRWAGSAVDRVLPGKAGKIIKTPFAGYGGSGLEGALNKAFFLTADVAAVNQSFQQAINPDKTAEIIYKANPGNYASLEEAKNEVRNFNIGEMIGIIGENVAQAGVSRLITNIFSAAATWGLRGIATAAAVAAAPVELPAVVVFGISVATFAAITFIYDKLNTMNTEQMSTQGELAKMSPDSYKKFMSGEKPSENETVQMYEQMSEGGIGGYMAGSFANQIIGNFSDATAREPGQRSRTEVNQLRQARGLYQHGSELTWYDSEGFQTKLKMYASFGERNAEVSALLSAGYFLTPAGNTDMGGFHPQVDRYGRRIFDIDYPAFVKWLEDTDWLVTDNAGIAQRVFKLPKIRQDVLQVIQQGPITTDEWRSALKIWYDMAANEQQKALLAPRP
jgi:hypothetical protein